jgi:hypothetical protein
VIRREVAGGPKQPRPLGRIRQSSEFIKTFARQCEDVGPEVFDARRVALTPRQARPNNATMHTDQVPEVVFSVVEIGHVPR